ncbi:MAG: cation diffusion facilitator family transporter [Candidatus Gottesmanbacteria bacterium]|nr:cation diffusion facilitator family transporter [Candidatus Gottesmanbacteria bacterium]
MKEKNLLYSIAINVVITVVEIIVGFFIGSLAIISDAVHNFFDVGAMVMSLIGEKVSSKKIDVKHTYGYKRTEVLIALLNSTFLLVSIVFIGYEAVKRLLHPEPISGGWMLGMALVAFAGNMIATKLLHAHAQESMNVRSAFLHSLQDALFSAGVIVAALLVLIFNWQWADAGISLVLSLLLAKEALSLILETVHVLMEGVPSSLDMKKLKQDLLTIRGVMSVSDLHVWNTGSKDLILTAHIAADITSDTDYASTLKRIYDLVHSAYNITHITIQLVPARVVRELEELCIHCS